MKVVCLASGGIDSSVLMLMLKQMEHEVLPIHINYGQKAAEMERNAFYKVCEFLRIKPEIIDITDIGKISVGLTNPNLTHNDNPLFPARNLLLLTVAASYAIAKSVKVISIGSLANSIFPDQTKEFVKNAESTLGVATQEQIKILTPLIDLNKREVVELARKYDFPLGITYSCHLGLPSPCGKCMSCKEREVAEKV
ncbi:MAG TPA: 7-cyano-7-deazaguanine synthase [Candidatus Nitrosotenuis sp.]|nr:7-cyano-7-deazaguanine synthase [Candidatus Nitrosotenuis sp.]